MIPRALVVLIRLNKGMYYFLWKVCMYLIYFEGKLNFEVRIILFDSRNVFMTHFACIIRTCGVAICALVILAEEADQRDKRIPIPQQGL